MANQGELERLIVEEDERKTEHDIESDEELLAESTETEDYRSWRGKLFRFLDDPASGQWGLWYAWFQSWLISGYIVLLCYDSTYHKRESGGSSFDNDAQFYIETVVTIIFTLDYVVRLMCVKNMSHLKIFVLNGMNIIDVLSIIPYYTVLAPVQADHIQILRAFRVIRLVRVFRLYRLYRHRSHLLRVFMRALNRAQGEIFFLFLLLIIVTVFFGMAMYYVETAGCTLINNQWVYTDGTKQGEKTDFQDIPQSFWWAIVTTAGVGYGDMYPVSFGGKLVAGALMFASFMFVAFPVTFLTAAYTETYEAYKNERAKAKISKLMSARRDTRIQEEEIEQAVNVRMRRTSTARSKNLSLIKQRKSSGPIYSRQSSLRVSSPPSPVHSFTQTAYDCSRQSQLLHPLQAQRFYSSESSQPLARDNNDNLRSLYVHESDTAAHIPQVEVESVGQQDSITAVEMRELMDELCALREELRQAVGRIAS
eukprot:CFRG7541T1